MKRNQAHKPALKIDQANICESGSPSKSLDYPQRGKRRYKPAFDVPMPNHPVARRLNALLDAHDWNRNRFIVRLRKNGAELKRRKNKDGTWKTKKIHPRRRSIRLEREQTFNALARAMIYRASFDPDAPYLFEVKASVEELAKMIGQLHTYAPGYDGENGQYRHGRNSCDPVHGALEDFEAADLVVVVRKFDKDSGTYKAHRIFFKPNFFRGFGLTMDDTKEMLSASRKWQEKHGLLASAKQKRQAELLRLTESDRIANIDRPSLKNLLARLKREFTGENKHTKQVLDSHYRLKKAEIQLKEKSVDARKDVETRLHVLMGQLPPSVRYRCQDKIKQEHGISSGEEFDKLLLAMLETYT